MMTITITNIQHFSTHDGQGIRTCVFFKGCPLRCKWCHNPETQSAGQQIIYNPKLCIDCRRCEAVCEQKAHCFPDTRNHIFSFELCNGCGKCSEVCPSLALENAASYKTVDEIMREVLRDRAFYGNHGGLTVSGGEPMFQPQECISLLKAAKQAGIHTSMETSGFFDRRYLEELAQYVDVFLWDYKDSNDLRHEKNTGVSNNSILQNLKLLDLCGANIILRCILINGINCETAHYDAVSDLYASLKHCNEVNLIRYHAFAGGKSVLLGREDNGHPEWIPSKQQMAEAAEYLLDKGVCVV